MEHVADLESSKLTAGAVAEEYSPEYCSLLEIAYGQGMMSEGGGVGIEHMFDQTPLQNKVALDIGSGMGGVAFYLAEKYSMHITGLEINSWMVEESKRRTPDYLKNKVKFLLITNNSQRAFSDEHFDIIYSKGVLTHLESKIELFKECHRLLKPDGQLVITDWLSPIQGLWGENIHKLIELENLTIFAETESNYMEMLKDSGFKKVSIRDEGHIYKNFNEEIVESLKKERDLFLNHFDEVTFEASVLGYESIARAIELGELRVLRFIAEK